MLMKIYTKITIIMVENREPYYFIAICKCKQGDYSKCAALVSPWRAIELTGIRRVITYKKGNKSHMSITFIQHSLKRHSSFCPAGSLRNATIVTLSDGCTLQINEQSSH